MPVPLSRPPVDDEIKAAVLAAIDSRQYILGPECKAFEQEFARYMGMKHAVLTSSATAAIWMILKAFGVKAEDEVLVPSHTAFPSVEAICFAGATPIFVDVDDSYTVDLKDAAAKVSPRTVGFVPVHLYGHPADLDGIRRLCAERSLWLLEDCAQAHGAAWQGRKVGTFGRAAAFSFYPSKNLTVMGDGGCICTNDDTLAERLRKLRNHGRKDKYTNDEIGYNLRFNEVQAAVGRVGLKHLDELNAHRRQVAARYTERLKGIVPTPPERSYAYHVYHMYVIRCGERGTAQATRDALAKFLQEHGIGTGIHYPVANHQQPAMTKMFQDIPKLPRTEQAVKEILSLPIYGELSLDDVDYVCDRIAEFYGKK